MKKACFVVVPLLILILGSDVLAEPGREDRKTGLYLGGLGHFQAIRAVGSWSGYEFDAREPLLVEEGDAVGLSWDNNFFLGAQPVLGFRFSRHLALEVGYRWSFPKSAQQAWYESDVYTYYEEGMLSEWKQSSFEALLYIYPKADSNIYLYGGLNRTRAAAVLTYYEGWEWVDDLGNSGSDYITDIYSDVTTTNGLVFGIGVEIPSKYNNRVPFFAARYVVAKTSGPFLGAEDFEVDLGGFSVMAGLKWYPFQTCAEATPDPRDRKPKKSRSVLIDR